MTDSDLYCVHLVVVDVDVVVVNANMFNVFR